VLQKEYKFKYHLISIIKTTKKTLQKIYMKIKAIRKYRLKVLDKRKRSFFGRGKKTISVSWPLKNGSWSLQHYIYHIYS